MLPSELGRLKTLKYLDVSFNKLNTVPTAIKDLQELVTLNLRNNRLTCVQHGILDLQKLQELYLLSNKIEYLSAEFHFLPELKSLSLDWFLYCQPAIHPTVKEEISDDTDASNSLIL
jgi:Leucine-rich repeat (LRR) protein